ncbi:reverse transcriptase [Elysia marginata]|uniref:Reverse transcriptase n=1 Tax=Elysia marginata TaxID=1093978 RepID=A0AAV4HGJ0_9GAST|nr:reverse transcriptase [Elysia marginata]
MIPTHCGNPGNEKADRLAIDVKIAVKGIYTQKWKSKSSGYVIRKDMMDNLPRKGQCMSFRLRTGHCLLRAHQYKIGISQTAMCECGIPQFTSYCKSAPISRRKRTTVATKP